MKTFKFITYVIIVLLVSQGSFVFGSTVSQGLLPLSKSGSTQVSWSRIRFDSRLESEDTGASSSTSVGSGFFSGETTDSEGGRMAWDLGTKRGWLLWVKLRFWSKQRPLPWRGEPARLFRESWPTSWFKFNWFVSGGRTVKRTRQFESRTTYTVFIYGERSSTTHNNDIFLCLWETYILILVRMLKMVCGFLSEKFTSCVLLRPIISQLATKAASQLLLSHTAAITQDSPHTPPKYTHILWTTCNHNTKKCSHFCSDSSAHESPDCGLRTFSLKGQIKPRLNQNLKIRVLTHTHTHTHAHTHTHTHAHTHTHTHTHTHPLMAGNQYRGTTPMQNTYNHRAEQQPTTTSGSITVSRLKHLRQRDSCDADKTRKGIS